MKKIVIVSLLTTMYCAIQAQTGIYQTSKFEYINKNDFKKNRNEFTIKTLILNLDKNENRSVIWEI